MLLCPIKIKFRTYQLNNNKYHFYQCQCIENCYCNFHQTIPNNLIIPLNFKNFLQIFDNITLHKEQLIHQCNQI